MKNIKYLFLTILLTFCLCLTTTVKALENEIENIEESNAVVEQIEVQEQEQDESLIEQPSSTDGEATSDGEVDVTKEAEIVIDTTPTDIEGDSREAEVTIEVDAEEFEETINPVTYDAIDVALVIDASQSMINETTITVDGVVQHVSRLEAAQIAAKKLVKSLLEANPNTRISLSIFNEEANIEQVLTSDINILNDAIDKIDWDYSTNVQDGINKGAHTLIYPEQTKNNEKVVVLLSDGDTNESTYTSYKNKQYTYEDGNKIKYTYSCKNSYSCDIDYKAAQAAADYFTNTHDIIFYTIGFGTGTSANNLLKYISGKEAGNTYPRFISADDGDKVVDAFKKIGETITTPKNTVATDAVLTDTIPNSFIITEEERTRLSETYSNLEIKDQTDGSTKLILNIGNITTDGIKLVFKILAKDDYHGSMYTNENAVLIAKPLEGNPYNYNLSNGKFTISLANPSVVIPAIAENDNVGNVKTTETKEILVSTILNNDSNSNFVDGTQLGNATSIKDIIEVISSTTKGILTLNSAKNGYIYKPTLTNVETNDNFTYRIKSVITFADNTTKTVYSNIATVSLTVKPVEASYTVHHYLKDTTTKVANDENYDTNLFVGDQVIGNAKTLDNYELVGTEPTQKVNLIDGTNEIIFYYQLKQGGKVTVYYYEEGTTNPIVNAEDLEGKITETYLSKPKMIENWELIEIPSNATGTFAAEEQSVIYYYKKIMGKLVVNYVDEYGKPVADSIITEGQKGTPYQTASLDLNDKHYVLIKTEGEENGTYTDEQINVTYIYQFVGGRGGDKAPTVPNTGIEDSYGLEIIFILSTILLLGTVVIKKRYN